MASKPYIFTDHILERMAERSIGRAWVVMVLAAPERTEQQADRPGRWRLYRRIADFGGRVLCVICDESETEVELVTTFFDRKKLL